MAAPVVLWMNSYFINGSNQMYKLKVNQLMLKKQAMIGIHETVLRFQNYCSFNL